MPIEFDISAEDVNPTVYFVAKNRMTKNGKYHSHPDFTEITLILSGTGQYIVDDITTSVETGDMLICNPGVNHANIVTDAKEPIIEFCAGFSDYHFIGMPENSIVLPSGGYWLHPAADTRLEMLRLAYEMTAEKESRQVGKYFMLKAMLLHMLMLIMREVIGDPVSKQKGYKFETYSKSYAVKRIIDYLTENYANKISLDRIAHNMYLSPVYISKIFKEETGESPINFLIKIRLEKAKDILGNAGLGSIKSIANDVGYDDVYHFSKLFKKYYGISPQNYRKSRG
jgi:AraC-like DNA-binding protein